MPCLFQNVISIPLLLKSPTSASLSALRAIIESLQHSNANLIQFNIIHSEVGTSMTQKEQIVLKESGGMFLGFDINVPKRISKNFGYQVISHNIIYRLFDKLKETVCDHYLPSTESLDVKGRARVRQVFNIKGEDKQTISVAGLLVTDGSLHSNMMFKVIKKSGEVSIEKSNCSSLRRVKDEVTVVKSGDECGLQLLEFSDFDIDDTIECFQIVREPQKLV